MLLRRLEKRLGLLAAGLLGVSCLGVASCQQEIPGIPEPTGWGCTIVDPVTLDCVHLDDPNMEPIERKTVDAQGYICLPPRTYGDALDHHEALHLKIEDLSGNGARAND